MLDFLNARKPMIVVGQDYPCSQLYGIKQIDSWAVTLIEPTALGTSSEDPACREFSSGLLVTNFDEVLNKMGDDEDYMPDFILYVGGTLVSKRLKKFLRLAVKKGAKVWRASTDGDYIDTFMRIDRIFPCDTTQLADAMTSYDQVYRDEVDAYKERWEKALWAAKRHAFDYEPSFSSMAAVKAFQAGYLAHSLDDTRECRLFMAIAWLFVWLASMPASMCIAIGV